MLRTLHEMEEVASTVAPTASSALIERRVTINGATMFFKKNTEHGKLDDVMARVATECASGEESAAFGLTERASDGKSGKPIRLQKIFAQESDGGVRASLCIFAKDGEGPDESHRTRYTLAHDRGDGTVAVTTVVNASSAALQELFPAEGDARGSDFVGIARPERARRTMTAVVGDGEHTVRVYESELSVPESVASYDRQMQALGYATTGSLDDARMFRKDGKSWVASFRGTTGGSTVALAPFGHAASQ